ncbi:MAG: primosomal protein N' [Bacteroidota bacterium]
MTNNLLANIALPLPLDKTFTYLVPPDLFSLAQPGRRAIVPFGKKTLTGVIVNLPENTTVKGLKPVQDILDDEPAFSAEMLSLTEWIAEYYMSPWGEVLRAATPQGLSQESKRSVHLLASSIETLLEKTKGRARSQHVVLQVLKDTPHISLSLLQKRSHVKSIVGILTGMQQQGWISLEESVEAPKVRTKTERTIRCTAAGKEAAEHENLNERQRGFLKLLQTESADGTEEIAAADFLKKYSLSLSILRTLAKKRFVAFGTREIVRISEYDTFGLPENIELNSDQQHALTEIKEAVDAASYKAFLLHGITGSGKTQVYIEAIRNVLALGKTAIVLVPEISLTPQTVRRFKSHFGTDVAVMHSQMSSGERYDTWRLAQKGRVRIVIGPRSAIFAPLKNIGLIVVDEEHESSYKQFDAVPRYNARDVAIVRALRSNAVVVLGSATPSIESYYNVQQKKYTLLELPHRVDTAKLPEVRIVDIARDRKQAYEDLKEEIKKSGKPFPKRLPDRSISKLLRDQIEVRLMKKEGIILMQNRRGFSHVFECYDCGFVEKCGSCEVSLTYHATKKHLRCHYCGYIKKPSTVCPKCGSTELRMHAFGTQQVEEELKSLFPASIILRMDRDTTTHRGAHHRILEQFGSGTADILLGTQMVAKGLDFPRVTLVGVISADTQMLLPDFRASEDTFQLLTQVAGRAGRSTLTGEVIIQTLQTNHYSLKHVMTHDFPGFYNEELEYRRELNYPPFSRIVLIEFNGERENEVQHHAQKFKDILQRFAGGGHSLVLGPADAAISKIKNLYRKHIVVKNLKSKDPSGTALHTMLRTARQQCEDSPLFLNKKVKMIIDIDPQGMM